MTAKILWMAKDVIKIKLPFRLGISVMKQKRGQ